MSELAHTNHTEKKDFLVRSSSLKDVRSFCREVFEKLHIDQSLKDELVLAIAEAAQNIVKHAYKDSPDTEDKMVVQISCKDNKLQIGFYDMGTPVLLLLMVALNFQTDHIYLVHFLKLQVDDQHSPI